MTEKLTSPRVVKELIEKHGFTFRKGLGQNFLIDENALNRIVAAADPTAQDWVLEIGPGIGTLTQVLAQSAAQVTAVEIDRSLLPILDETLSQYKNVKIINDDVLKVDIKKLVPSGLTPKVAANLPYYITTPVIFQVLESSVRWERLVFLVQKEVAERLAADPGSKDYGAPSVTVQARARTEVAAIIPAGCFMPQPKVASAVLVLFPYRENKYAISDYRLFRTVVKAAFGQRRKTLVNALASAEIEGLAKKDWIRICEQSGIDPRTRAEQLSVSDFAQLSNKLADR